ncbi:unnamed protein product [Vicia faba]|uniref:F-box domain-containing protein n=1 Tax=Vicia faba TaxID=3906 RepID=A0AAV0ZVS0_VICFA|nr:unnamed protein product [Vicia faba]
MDAAETPPLPERKQPQQTLTSLHVSFDLVAEILCRLSVKHLIQLCCVCKSWNSLISHDSNLAKKHLRFSTSCHDRYHLVMNSADDSPELVLCHSPISSIFSSAAPTQFRYPLKEIKGDCYMETSACDGILCISIELMADCFVLLYDRFTNIYKIIAIHEMRSNKIEVYIHTLGTDYWRRIVTSFLNPEYL